MCPRPLLPEEFPQQSLIMFLGKLGSKNLFRGCSLPCQEKSRTHSILQEKSRLASEERTRHSRETAGVTVSARPTGSSLSGGPFGRRSRSSTTPRPQHAAGPAEKGCGGAEATQTPGVPGRGLGVVQGELNRKIKQPKNIYPFEDICVRSLEQENESGQE